MQELVTCTFLKQLVTSHPTLCWSWFKLFGTAQKSFLNKNKFPEQVDQSVFFPYYFILTMYFTLDHLLVEFVESWLSYFYQK